MLQSHPCSVTQGEKQADIWNALWKSVANVTWDSEPWQTLSFLRFLKHHILKDLLYKYGQSQHCLRGSPGVRSQAHTAELRLIFRNASRGQRLPIHRGDVAAAGNARAGSSWQRGCSLCHSLLRDARSPFLLYSPPSELSGFPTPSICSLSVIPPPETGVCFKQNKTQQLKHHQPPPQKSPQQKIEAESVKGVPGKSVALLLTCYQKVDCRSIFCHRALRAWTQ